MPDLCRVETNNNDCDLLVVNFELLCSISDDSEQSGKTFLFVRMSDRMLTMDITINIAYLIILKSLQINNDNVLMR